MKPERISDLPAGSLLVIKSDDRLPVWTVLYLGDGVFFTPIGVKGGRGWTIIMDRHLAKGEMEVL